MPQANDPIILVQAKVVRLQSALLNLRNNFLVKIRPMAQSLSGFLASLRRDARAIAAIIGRSAVDRIVALGTALIQAFETVQRLVSDLIKKIKKVLVTIQRAISRGIDLVHKVLKQMIQRQVAAMRELVQRLRNIIMNMSPLEIVIMVIQSMKETLESAFPWLRQHSDMPKLISKAKRLASRHANLIQAEAKQVVRLVKEVDKLKPS